MWNVFDLHPNSRLSEIHPVSLRALSWAARAPNEAAFPKDIAFQVGGGARILKGLDYHHNIFMAFIKGLDGKTEREKAFLAAPTERERFAVAMCHTPEEWAIVEAMEHEAVAYLNRLGQFFTFARSLKVQGGMTRAAETDGLSPKTHRPPLDR